MKQYRDELLAACLTFILALPKEVIIDQMRDVVPAIQVHTVIYDSDSMTRHIKGIVRKLVSLALV
jgi:hypothetical protein